MLSELFSESFLLSYTKTMNKFILQNYSMAYNSSQRSDIFDFFSMCIDTTQDIIKKCTEVLMAKGLYLKSPYLVIPDRIDFVKEKDYYGSLFGSNRPLNAIEVGNIFNILKNKLTLNTLTLGFAQVAKDEKIRKFLVKGTEISEKHVQVLGKQLHEWNLPIPTTPDFEISTSTESPFSDKLIVFHTTVVTSYTMLEYGRALTNSARKDLIRVLTGLVTDLLDFAKDGMDIMIENHWLERVPETADRKELVQ